MPPKKEKKLNKAQIYVDEQFRIIVNHLVDQFLNDEEAELKFPSSFTKTQRAYIHTIAAAKNLNSKSHLKGANRYISIIKKVPTTKIKNATFDVSTESRRSVFNLLKTNPLTQREVSDVTFRTHKPHHTQIPSYRFSVGTFSKSYIAVPPFHQNQDFQRCRRNLPVFDFRQEILNSIEANQVLVISGETGSGKTTQIPQYILEDANFNRKNCRIICTQPRRLSAISVAERVVQERGEQLGTVVGYQIRLESRTSPTSNLIYCTNGILLRCLMGESRDDIFASMTHIIVDEVHERDKFSDFLLIALKRNLKKYPKLKLILMSATIESDVFSKYFFDCNILTVPGRLFEVEQFYLDDLLAVLDYKNKKMLEILKNVKLNEDEVTTKDQTQSTQNITNPLDDETIYLLNETLDSCAKGSDDNFHQFIYLVEGENVPVDFRHTTTDMTALMIAACKGNTEMCKTLLSLGADPLLKSIHGLNSIEWSLRMNEMQCHQLFSAYIGSKNLHLHSDRVTQKLLEAYQKTVNDEFIDYDVIYFLIKHIHSNFSTGSILVFLSGYEDIIEINDLIVKGIENEELNGNIKIYMLHSNMSTVDQKSVFHSAPFGCRKIILSTNIAETSITIDDVVYVIDSGKVKQKGYDSMSGTSSLMVTWISKACSKQRSGRAGRTQPGKCFKIFSRDRYNSMEEYTIPEILRVPLTEICLQSKLISPQTSISDFLAEAIQPPTSLSIKQGIRLLKAIDALDEDENLTELGLHLVDLPVDAQLGKILIYAIILRCLDPVLTIVSALSVKDPFILPTVITERKSALEVKKKMAEKSYSDHLALLKIFQKWLEHKAMKKDIGFCHKHYISSGNMETICGVRSQILGYLRAVGLVQSNGAGNIHDLNQNSDNWALVKACLVSGLYPNISCYDRENNKLTSKLENKVLVHPSSVLRENRNNELNLPTDWIVFVEKSKIGHFSFIKTNTVVTPLAIALFSGSMYKIEKAAIVNIDSSDDSSSDTETNQNYNGHYSKLVLDEWINFKLPTDTAYMIFNLRQKMNALFLKFIHNPRTYFKHEIDTKVISTIAKMLQQEEQFQGLPQPGGIGDRPRAVILNLSTPLNFGIQEKSDFVDLTKKLKATNLNTRASTSYQSLNSSNNAQSTSSLAFYRQDDGMNISDAGSSNCDNSDRPVIRLTPNTHIEQYFKPLPGLNNLSIKITNYVMIKAASTVQVYNTFGTDYWSFSSSVLKSISRTARSYPPSDIIIFFHVLNEKQFVGVGKYIIFPNRRIDCLSKKRISFHDVRKIFERLLKDRPDIKPLDRCLDGEMLSGYIGELFLNLMLADN